MPPDTAPTEPVPPAWATLRRFLIYLWPKDAPALRRRVVLAMALVLAGKAVGLSMSFFYKWAIDRMAPGLEPAVAIAVALVAAYALARFGATAAENFRNVVFERVGQEATRTVAPAR
jgi:hypothetical protein